MSAYDTFKAGVLGDTFDPNKKPSRTLTVKAFAEMQVQVEGAQAGALVKDTLVNLQALTSVSEASIMAWVTSDTTQSNNGIYENTGTDVAPAWTRRADIPQFVISAINEGTGTANEIEVTTDLPVPVENGRCLILLPIFEENTGITTVNINGAGALRIKSISGADVLSGSLLGGMIVCGYISGANFYLISDIASAAIVTQAEAARDTAIAASGLFSYETVTAMQAETTALTVGSYVRVNQTGAFYHVSTSTGAHFNPTGSGVNYFKEAGPFSTVARFQDALDRGVVFQANDSVVVNGDIFVKDGGSSVVTGWSKRTSTGALSRFATTCLPAGNIEIPSEINNPLGALIYWDGKKVQYVVEPFKLIDFTEKSDVSFNEYFVNYLTGSDANDGLGTGTAWKTIEHAEANMTSPAILYVEDEWVGINSLGNAFHFDGNNKWKSVHSSGITRLTNMNENYTKSTYNWVDEGDGMWSTSAATTSATIFSRLGTMVFDNNYKDSDGGASPVPDVGSDTACRTKPGSQFHDTANSKKFVHLLDGREPDPFDGFIYSHSAGGTNFQQLAATDGTILLDGFHSYRNAKNATSANIRHRNDNSTSANTCKFGMIDCLVYGGSGNNIHVYDAEVSVLQRVVAKYAHKDAISLSSFVSTGDKGSYQTQYIHDCVGLESGYDKFSEHVSLGGSENAFTGHNGAHVILTNPVGADSVGSNFAYVNGCFVAIFNPIGAKPGGDWPYVFWHEQYLKPDTKGDGIMFIWGGSAHDNGDATVALISNVPQAGGSVNNGDVRLENWLGQVDGTVIGNLLDFDGN